jgi:HAD superfamily hydrolase (TIGR01509 family)
VISPVAAVLFDLDGTLVDSEKATTAAIIETLARFGCHVTADQIAANAGGPLLAWFANTLGLNADVAHTAYWQYVETIKARADLVIPAPGASQLLERLQRQRIPMAVVTNRLTQIAFPIIEAACWTDLFQVVVGQETAAKPKPAPDPALFALSTLSVRPEHAAYVGDTAADMLCAVAAGLTTIIGVHPSASARAALLDTGATHICESLGEVQTLLLS